MDLVRFVDISALPTNQTQGFQKAVLFCTALSKEFIISVRNGEEVDYDEFGEKEHKTDALADLLAEFLRQKGYGAYSQSEKSHLKNNNFDVITQSSILPHKTIARIAGIGYIGRNNLLITKEYGCAFSMCTVLTNAPLITKNHPLVLSKCGECDICKRICSTNAIFGNDWAENTGREGICDVIKCTCEYEYKCMVNCPQTLKYAIKTDVTV